MTKNGSKDFSDFWCTVSRVDSLSFYANRMPRKILVLKLWPKKLSANQIARLLFQTLTKNDFKEFSEFLLSTITYRLHVQETFRFLSYDPKISGPIRLLDYFFRLWQRTTVRNFLNLCMVTPKNLCFSGPILMKLKLWYLLS